MFYTGKVIYQTTEDSSSYCEIETGYGMRYVVERNIQQQLDYIKNQPESDLFFACYIRQDGGSWECIEASSYPNFMDYDEYLFHLKCIDANVVKTIGSYSIVNGADDYVE